MATIIEKIKAYFNTNPDIYAREINVNYLGYADGSISIENVPSEPVVKRYSDGATLRQYCFLLVSREAYDGDSTANTEVSKFYENFERWIDTNNNAGNLPDLSELGLKAEKLEVVKSGCVYNTAKASARFQMELRLLYKQNY